MKRTFFLRHWQVLPSINNTPPSFSSSTQQIPNHILPDSERETEMRPASTISTPFWNWNSPLPYLFGGLALMLLLISVALIILACSYRKRASNSDEEKSMQKPESTKAADIGPKFVVILAGEENPTHLAIPIPNSLCSASS